LSPQVTGVSLVTINHPSFDRAIIDISLEIGAFADLKYAAALPVTN